VRATTTRRNRAALRDYYNIKASAAGEAPDAQPVTSTRGLSTEAQTALSDLDKEGFDAGDYVRRLLEREGLEGVLKVENELVGEIRGLDGDRKALVYDNYSKLISATDTIRKVCKCFSFESIFISALSLSSLMCFIVQMRTNMDPLTPTTSTLAPAISHIAEIAATLSNDLATHVPAKKGADVWRQSSERQTVQWVLDAPDRLEQLLLDDREAEAHKDWDTVRALLENWKGVEGVDQIRTSCEKALNAVDN
jgi:hypothetical protein